MPREVPTFSELFRTLASRPVSRWPPLCGQNAPSETWQNQKARAGGPQGVAQGAKWLFFAKNGHFSTFDRTTALCSMRIEVCCAFLQKNCFFLRDFFSIFVIFLPLPAAGRALRCTAGGPAAT